MAKSKEKNKALILRRKGESIKEIAKRLKISKGTISFWCRDITLTPKQVQILHKRMVSSSYKGRLKGARIQYEQRLERTKRFKKQGFKRVGKLSDRDFLIAGAALYWGEGQKKGREVRISNSDPEIIKFMLKWFKRVWEVDKKRFTLFVIINKIHAKRLKEIEAYWSGITNIPKLQFTKTTLIKAKNKKDYKNAPVHYGTLTIRVRRPTELHHKIIGLIEGLT